MFALYLFMSTISMLGRFSEKHRIFSIITLVSLLGLIIFKCASHFEIIQLDFILLLFPMISFFLGIAVHQELIHFHYFFNIMINYTNLDAKEVWKFSN